MPKVKSTWGVGSVKFSPHLGTSKLPPHTKFWCKGKETKSKSSKLPLGGTPVVHLGVGGRQVPPHLEISKLPTHAKFWGPKCKGKETRAKS